mgnify:CR=1 FL=1
MTDVRASDRAKLSAQQKVDLDRISASRLEEYIGQPVSDNPPVAAPTTPIPTLRDKFFDRASKMTDAEFRARVNIESVSDTINFAPESDYSDDDKALIEAVLPRTKWGAAIPKLLDAASQLRSDGMGEATIRTILSAG